MVPRPSCLFVCPNPNGNGAADLPIPPFWNEALKRTAIMPGRGIPNPNTLFVVVNLPNSWFASLSFWRARTTLSIADDASCSVILALRLLEAVLNFVGRCRLIGIVVNACANA
jgi:hypothetical protein